MPLAEADQPLVGMDLDDQLSDSLATSHRLQGGPEARLYRHGNGHGFDPGDFHRSPTFAAYGCSDAQSLRLVLLPAWDAEARDSGGDKAYRKHDLAVLKGDNKRFLAQIPAQHRVYLG